MTHRFFCFNSLSVFLICYDAKQKIYTEEDVIWNWFLIKIKTKIILKSRLVFSRFLDLHGSLGNVKEKPAKKTCFSREKKRLALRIYLAKFC